MPDAMDFMIEKLRSQFSQEWAWRLYVVLTIAGVVGVVLLDFSQHNNWDLLFDFFDAWHWQLNARVFYNYANWLALALLFGPFLIAKVLDWITEKKG